MAGTVGIGTLCAAGLGAVAPIRVAADLVSAPSGTQSSEASVETSVLSAAEVSTPPPPPCEPAALEDRAAAVLMVGMPGVVRGDEALAAELTGIGVGAVLLGDGNVVERSQVQALVERLRADSERPLLVAIDEEGGRVSTTRSLGPVGPSARALGQRPVDEVEAAAEFLGGSLRALGIDVLLGPVADADGGPARAVIGDRAYAAAPEAVVGPVLAVHRGLEAAGVAATAKHFPGRQRAGDPHSGPVRVDAGGDDLRGSDLVPFQALVDADVPVVMIGHVSFSGLGALPSSVSPPVYELLRSTGFGGVALTDSLDMEAISDTWDAPEAGWRAVAAGADLVLVDDGRAATAMRDELMAAIFTGQLPESRLDEAVGRVLELRGEDPATMVCS